MVFLSKNPSYIKAHNTICETIKELDVEILYNGREVKYISRNISKETARSVMTTVPNPEEWIYLSKDIVKQKTPEGGNDRCFPQNMGTI
ncbi:hypothetical protein C5167_037093 [Papaver somniferum]|uniref:Uncharacterized protein n=1 Tax=Papaver somniferum TaxID=3469 RepID=A0A4Y7I8J5_PAPSO|nr:hypothetical protein C5167_037093 [Papaver somniferum]